MMRFNNWMGDCVDFVANNSRKSTYDKELVAWVRLLKITEEMAVSLSFDDPSNMADMLEPRVLLLVTGFERALETWKKTHEPECTNGMSLLSSYCRSLI